MPGLLIKDVPTQVHRRLRMRAAASHRSMSREALVILEEALDDRAGPLTLAQTDALRQKGKKPLTDDVIANARELGRP
jgi:plasmid stability protein